MESRQFMSEIKTGFSVDRMDDLSRFCFHHEIAKYGCDSSWWKAALEKEEVISINEPA